MSTKDADFRKLYEKLTTADWQMLAEIEGILNPIFVQSTSTAQQNNASNASLNPYYRRKVLKILDQEKFQIMDIDHKCGISDSVTNWPRKDVSKTDLGEGGKVCDLFILESSVKIKLTSVCATTCDTESIESS